MYSFYSSHSYSYISSYVMNSEIKPCSPQTVKLLQMKHALYKHAEKPIIEQFHTDSVVVNNSLWGITAMICIMSSDTWEIYKLLHVLSNSCTDCTIMVFIFIKSNRTYTIFFCKQEVTEKIYCICTFLLYFSQVFDLPAR